MGEFVQQHAREEQQRSRGFRAAPARAAKVCRIAGGRSGCRPRMRRARRSRTQLGLTVISMPNSRPIFTRSLQPCAGRGPAAERQGAPAYDTCPGEPIVELDAQNSAETRDEDRRQRKSRQQVTPHDTADAGRRGIGRDDPHVGDHHPQRLPAQGDEEDAESTKSRPAVDPESVTCGIICAIAASQPGISVAAWRFAASSENVMLTAVFEMT